jgi:hypothetical protein
MWQMANKPSPLTDQHPGQVKQGQENGKGKKEHKHRHKSK